MDIPRERRRSQAVNLTPLIDVVFLLIVFFMLSTSFVVSESMELGIPGDGAKAAAATDVWVLNVKPDGEVLTDDKRYGLKEFDRILRKKMLANQEQKILLLAEKDTTVQQLVSVLDRLYLAGARQVQIDKDEAK